MKKAVEQKKYIRIASVAEIDFSKLSVEDIKTLAVAYSNILASKYRGDITSHHKA